VRRTIIKWDYDKHEILADSIVRALGVVGGLVAVIVLLALAAPTAGAWELTSVAIYGAGLMAVLVISALYNLWPFSPVKWILRRFDHSAIYLLIAGTYTPFIIQMKNEITAIVLLLGWSGTMAYETLFGALSNTTLALLGVGGCLYTFGVVFNMWEGLRFQNAIWHAFVLVAAACHYGAVLDCVVLTRT
jgi:hemolysin III